jgi:hypothetical protein
MHAQVATADVLGTVTDSTGAVVPDAKVTAADLSTGVISTVQTDKAGEYLFSHLQVGTYKLTVTAKGFKSYVQSDLTLNANDRARVDAKLEVGSATETVEVNMAAAPELKTDSSTMDTTITTTAVSDMPLNGRNIQNLVQLSAGVTEGAANAPGGAQGFNGHTDDLRPTSVFSANGMNDMYNNQMIDGMDNNERSIGTQVIKPSLDAIDQVIVMTNLYPAEYGRSAGGVMNVITKAGGNAFHGTLYEYDRNDDLDAYSDFLPTMAGTATKGEHRQNQFGGSVSGPILKNKAFFFGDYEGFRMIDAVGTTSGAVPDLNERAALSGMTAGRPVTFTDDRIGTTVTITPTALGINLYDLFPAPTSSTPLSPTNTINYTGHNRNTQNADTFDARIDEHFTAKDLLFGRYSYNKTNTGIGYPFLPITINSMPYDNTLPVTTTTNGVGLDWTHILSPAMVFEAKAGYNRFQNVSGVTSGEGAATNLGFASCSAGTGYCINSPYGGADEGLPSINLNHYGLPAGPAMGIGDGMFSPLHNTSQAYQYAGSLIWNRGSHSMKFGVLLIRRQLTRIQSPSARGSYSDNGYISGSDLGDMIQGIATSVQQQTALNFPQYRSWEPGAYAQDDWRVKHWLTLNLGLRYDIYTPFTDKHGEISNFNEAKGVLESPTLLGLYHGSDTGGILTTFTNIAPRFGFSASLSHQIVVRGGGGITYFATEQGGGTGVSMANFPYSWNVDYGGAPYNVPVPAGMAISGATLTNGFTTCSNTSSAVECAINMAAGITEPYLSASTVTDLPTGTEIDAVENTIKPGRVVQYSLEVEKQYRSNVMALGYVGNAGRHMPVAPDINQPVTASSPWYYTAANTLDGQNLSGDSIYETASDADSNYNALQATFTRRLTSGLMVNANYTWAKAMNNGSPQGEGGSRPVECWRAGCLMDNGNGGTTVLSGFKQYDWGLSDLQVHHRLTAMAVYAIPAGNPTGALGYIAKDWNLSGIWVWSTGMPESVTNCMGPPPCPMGGNQSGIGGWRGPDAPDQTGSPNNGPKTVTEWFNTSAFTLQTANTLGNSKRNAVIGPSEKHLDLSVTKDFPLYEAMKLQFRADAFNASNTPSLGEPGSSLNGGGWGEITSMANTYTPREFQISLRLSF